MLRHCRPTSRSRHKIGFKNARGLAGCPKNLLPKAVSFGFQPRRKMPWLARPGKSGRDLLWFQRACVLSSRNACCFPLNLHAIGGLDGIEQRRRLELAQDFDVRHHAVAADDSREVLHGWKEANLL